MHWLTLALSSAFLLGFYEVAKKAALKDNSVLGVLMLSSWCGLGFVALTSLLLAGSGAATRETGFQLDPLSLQQHGLVLVKALLVSSSWIATFFALKHLPLSLAGPLRASAPLYTLLGAVLLFGERPSVHQWWGIACMLGSYLVFSQIGQKEDIHLTKSRWAGLLAVGTILGSLSGLYDKHLLGPQLNLPPWALQFWFTLYHTLVLSMVAGCLWWPNRKATTPLQFRPSIALIALCLLVADQLYFRALAKPESLVAIVSLTRRSSVLVSFLVGGLLFREKNLRKKGLALVGVAVGLVLLVL